MTAWLMAGAMRLAHWLTPMPGTLLAAAGEPDWGTLSKWGVGMVAAALLASGKFVVANSSCPPTTDPTGRLHG